MPQIVPGTATRSIAPSVPEAWAARDMLLAYLIATARTDRVGACADMPSNEVMYVSKCEARQVVTPTSEFRMALRNTLEQWQNAGREVVANAFLPLMTEAISARTLMPQDQVWAQLVTDYTFMLGHPPPAGEGAPPPEVIVPTAPVSPISPGPTGPLVPTEDYQEDTASGVSETPWLWIGLGAVVLVGGALYFMTQKT